MQALKLTCTATMNSGFDPELIQRYNTSGPRYTSYPTALQFDQIDPEDHAKAVLGSPLKDNDASLYLHIPFCSTLCYYCACNKFVTRKYELAARYLKCLQSEIRRFAPQIAGRRVSQIHWGGGTPTFLTDEDISQLFNTLREEFALVGDDEGEFGIEIDPRTVDGDRVKFLREVGFNRLSMGIQDFDPAVQKAVNRKQAFDDTEKVFAAARECGFESISVDLIYGLPLQTVEKFRETLAKVVTLNPDRISIFNYAHLPDRFPPQKRILLEDIPAAETKLAILELCIEYLEAAGYVRIGMDHFAKPDDSLAVALREGKLQRNFQGYSTYAESDMFAFGVTAISKVGHSYWQNSKELDDYCGRVEAKESPLERGLFIDADDQLRAKVISELMCQFRVNFADYDVNFVDYFWAEIERLKSFERDQLIRIDDKSIQVTDRGRLLVRNLCMEFDRHLRTSDPKRFSKAV